MKRSQTPFFLETARLEIRSVAVTNKENLKSRQVLEKVGMVLKKEINYHGVPSLYYEISKSVRA
jgi:predicted acetyltransferase